MHTAYIKGNGFQNDFKALGISLLFIRNSDATLLNQWNI